MPAAEVPPETASRGRTGWWVAGLLLAVFVAYLPALSAGFLNLDDDRLVTQNPLVVDGFTGEGLRRAFTEGHQSNWVPLTWTSHMLDVELFGMEPMGHHATNLALHLLNVLLLFLLSRRLLQSDGGGLFVALLFGLHPLHVESVAWVAERKDVLSTAFLLGTTLIWLRFVRRPNAGRYALAALLFALGLMSKQMLVTLPCVFLLLDWWPLGRVTEPARASWRRLALEKLPLFALAGGAGLATVFAQRAGGAVQAMADVPLWARPLNAGIAVVTYLYKVVVPHGLAIFVPHPLDEVSVPLGVAALLAIAALTWLAFRARARRPYLLVGWLWYLGTLLPVIGLLQVGEQALAYRYTYVPMIGVYIALVAWAREWKLEPGLARAVAIALGLVLSALTFRHARHWHDSEAAYLYAIASTERNHVAHSNLAAHYTANQRFDEALRHAREALGIDPDYADAAINAAAAAGQLGLYRETIDYCEVALARRPADPRPLYNRAIAQLALGEVAEAERSFEGLLERAPDHLGARQFAGRLALQRGDLERARAHFEHALGVAPDNAPARFGLGRVHQLNGAPEAALALLAPVCAQQPQFFEAQLRRAEVLATLGRWDEAVAAFGVALELRPGDANASAGLEQARARAGQ